MISGLHASFTGYTSLLGIGEIFFGLLNKFACVTRHKLAILRAAIHDEAHILNWHPPDHPPAATTIVYPRENPRSQMITLHVPGGSHMWQIIIIEIIITIGRSNLVYVSACLSRLLPPSPQWVWVYVSITDETNVIPGVR